MRGAGIAALGAPVGILDLDEPAELGPDEVLIEVRAAGVGNWDELVRTGSWQVGGPPPMALGVEAAGRILAVGGGVSGLAVGNEVLAHPLPLRRNGTWAARIVAPAATVAPKPADVAFETAAAFPVPALTALQTLEALSVERGEVVLVNGAGGVTGGLLVQLAALNGAEVVATAGPPSASRVLGYGAREVFDYRDPEWPERAGRLGVAAAANAARGGAAIALRAVADGGRLATITGDPPASERGVAIANVYVRPDGGQLTRLADLLAAGRLTVEIARVLPLASAAEALAVAASGHAHGAVVLSLA